MNIVLEAHREVSGFQNRVETEEWHPYVQLILNEEEVKIKTAMWMRQNADFLIEMKGICLASAVEFHLVWVLLILSIALSVSKYFLILFSAVFISRCMHICI